MSNLDHDLYRTGKYCQYRKESGEPFRTTDDQWDRLYQRLSWRYGPDEARERRMGRHPASMADEAAWSRLGASNQHSSQPPVDKPGMASSSRKVEA